MARLVLSLFLVVAAFTAPAVASSEPDQPQPTMAEGSKAITLTSVPHAAEVFTPDGVQMGVTPLMVAVRAGAKRELVLRKEGYEDARVTLSASTGPRVNVRLKRKKAP